MMGLIQFGVSRSIVGRHLMVGGLFTFLIAILPFQTVAQQKTELPNKSVVISAVDKVRQLVVRLETIGGSEQVGGKPFRSQASTGTIVNSKGMVLTAAYNLAHDPTAIFATYPDGTRVPMSVVARNTSRNVILLMSTDGDDASITKQLSEKDFSFVSRSELAAGQSAIAIGCNKSEAGKLGQSLSLGIISATNRIMGRAIQTDANVSATNYGGPLVNIQGQMIGLLVPLSRGGSGVADGLEWYDSGIGFAVPFDELRLEKMAAGEDQNTGFHGIHLGNNEGYKNKTEIQSVEENSPAAKSGIERYDKIRKINGIEVQLATQAKHLFGPLYAGDELELEVNRDGESLKMKFKLESKPRE